MVASSSSSISKWAATPRWKSCASATTPCSSQPASTRRARSKRPGIGLGRIVPALEYLITANRKGPRRRRAGIRLRQTRCKRQGCRGDRRRRYRDGLRAHGYAPRRKIGLLSLSSRPRQHAGQPARSGQCRRRRRRFQMADVAQGDSWARPISRASASQRMRLGLPDASGRKSPEEIKGADFMLKADLAIKALGFDPEDLPEIFAAPDLAVTRWGTLRVEAIHHDDEHRRAYSPAATSCAAPRSSSGRSATAATRPPPFTAISKPKPRRPCPRRRNDDDDDDFYIDTSPHPDMLAHARMSSLPALGEGRIRN